MKVNELVTHDKGDVGIHILGRCSFVEDAATMANPPLNRPAPPIPAIAIITTVSGKS